MTPSPELRQNPFADIDTIPQKDQINPGMMIESKNGRQYRVMDELGEGGMGQVFLVDDLPPGMDEINAIEAEKQKIAREARLKKEEEVRQKEEDKARQKALEIALGKVDNEDIQDDSEEIVLLDSDVLEEIEEDEEGEEKRIANQQDEEAVGTYRAMKVLHAEARTDEYELQRFKREIELLAKMKNPFILDIIDVAEFEQNGENVVGIVMDFVEGPDLKDQIPKQGMEPSRAINFIGQTAIALETLRKAGIVHRDLKPQNIFIEEISDAKGLVTEEIVKVGDFGIAGLSDRAFEQIDPNKYSNDVMEKITATGSIFGSPMFISPELLRGEPVTHKADLYALGLILYEMVSGKPPFPSNSLSVIINNQLNDYPTPLINHGIEVPAWLEEGIYKLIDKDPANRFDSAADFFAYLKKGVEKDYPELLEKIPFQWDVKKVKEGVQVRDLAVAS